MECCPCCRLNKKSGQQEYGRPPFAGSSDIFRGAGQNACAKDYVPDDDVDIEGELGPLWIKNPWLLPTLGIIGIVGGVLGAVGTFWNMYRTTDLTFDKYAHNPDPYIQQNGPYPGR